MTNEAYMIASYFTMGGVSILIGLITYVVMRKPFKAALEVYSSEKVIRIFRRTFLYGLVFPAIAGFMSVSYYSCSQDTYEKVVAKRDYLIGRNFEQTEAIFTYLLLALFVWTLIITVGVIVRLYHRTKIV